MRWDRTTYADDKDNNKGATPKTLNQTKKGNSKQ